MVGDGKGNMEKEKLIEQIGNSGAVCPCGAYMYANVYEDKYVIICPICGYIFEIKRVTESCKEEELQEVNNT